MKTPEEPREELLALAAELRRLRAAHLQSGVGSTARRHLETRIHEVSYHLDRRLEALVDGREDRDAWRHHAHGGPAPQRPEPASALAAGR